MMRCLLFLFLHLISFSVFANVNCESAFKNVVKLHSWTGDCVGGYLNGNGELVIEFNDKSKAKHIAKFKNGFPVGVILIHALVHEGNQVNSYATQLYYKPTPDSTDRLPIGPELHSRLQTYTYKDFDWYEFDSNGNTKGKITFNEAMNNVENFMLSKNSESMDFKTFRAYLEGGTNVQGGDDPPVLGVALKPSVSKAKKKK